ncbi:Solute carrier family 35 member G1 [Orchesella cincta]|uniref:Solute carrier family 35 member G1 n=1 Tax=Orchesella cincta TaxID=48709 RepID=A0A1D2N3P3_ORCCI|nr:Solute carrier family 35 member G1 [Orchesella cincta]
MGDTPKLTGSSAGMAGSSENTRRKSINRTNSTTNARSRTGSAGSVTFDETTINIVPSPDVRIQMGTTSPTSSQQNLPKQINPRGGTATATLQPPHNKRQSGLFSPDDISIDESVIVGAQLPTPRQLEANVGILAPPGAGEGGEVLERMRPHPMSIAGSSIGSGSYENMSASEIRKKNRRRKWRRFKRKYKGCAFAMMSSFVSSLANFLAHDLLSRNARFSPSYLLACRYVGVLLPGIFIAMYYCLYKKEPIFEPLWPLKEGERIKKFFLSVLRVVIDVVAIFLNYEAFKYLLQSEASTILNSKPVVVQLLAHVTLGEPWGVVPILMSLVASFGVLVISKPPFFEGTSTSPDSYVEKRLPGIGYAVVSMLLASCVYIILRYLKDIHFSVVSIFIGTGGILFGVVYTSAFTEWVMPSNTMEFILLITLAVLVCLSSITIVIALQNEEAFVVSLVRSCDTIFSFIWEMCISQKYPDYYTGGGACIVMFCVIVIFFRKYVSHQDPTSKTYRRFRYLTK